jgi:hypothetical protein
MPLYRTERVIASLTVAWVIILTTYMIFQDHALSHTSIYFLKIILSLSGAVMLATLPGFFDVNYSIGGFSVRAAGGAAAFVFIYTQAPNIPSLKAEPAPPRQEKTVSSPGSDRLSSRSDVYPVLMAVAISPAFNAAGAARPKYEGVWAEAGAGLDSGGLFGGTGHKVSVVEAVSADLRAGVAVAMDYAQRALHRIKGWLDIAAERFRSVVGSLIEAGKTLLGQTPAEVQPVEIIGAVTEDVAPVLDEVTGTLTGGITHSLTVALQNVGTSVTGTLSGTVGAVTALTDRTVDALVAAVHVTSQDLIAQTQALLGNATHLTDRTIAILPPVLADPVADITQAVLPKTTALVDGALRDVGKTGDGLLEGLSARVNAVTEQINAVSPSIIGAIDPAFAATDIIPDLAKGIDNALVQDRLDALENNLGTIAGNLTRLDGSALDLSSEKSLLGGGLSGLSGPLESGKVAGGLGAVAGNLGCLAGCGQGGLANTGLAGGGGALGLGGAPSGPADNGGPASGGGGGLVSSTLGAAGSTVGKVLSPLKRR